MKWVKLALTANLFVIILGLTVINLKSVGIYSWHVVLYWSWGWTCEPQTMKTPHIRNNGSNLHQLFSQWLQSLSRTEAGCLLYNFIQMRYERTSKIPHTGTTIYENLNVIWFAVIPTPISSYSSYHISWCLSRLLDIFNY